MVAFSPFVGQVIRPDFVRRVPAPAFDSMSAPERVEYLSTHPESYTLVTRSPGDGGPEDDASSERLIELGAQALHRIVESGAFLTVEQPSFFLLRLTRDGHSQTGIVGLVDSADYLDGRVKRHEQVASDRALHLSHHFEQLGAQSSPIALGYRADEAVSARIDEIVSGDSPLVDFVSGDGLEQTVWSVTDPDTIALFSGALVDRDLYIMDGHHRAAAAGELYKRLGVDGGGHMLGVLFGADTINIEPFHRRVRIPDHLDPAEVHARLVETLQLIRDDSVVDALPNVEGAVGVWSAGAWWSGVLPLNDMTALGAIDPVRLQRTVIGPVCQIDPENPGGAIGYFLDAADRAALSARVEENEILFVLRAVTPEQVFAVADAGLDMPPKSTYVTPKPRSGVFLRRF